MFGAEIGLVCAFALICGIEEAPNVSGMAGELVISCGKNAPAVSTISAGRDMFGASGEPVCTSAGGKLVSLRREATSDAPSVAGGTAIVSGKGEPIGSSVAFGAPRVEVVSIVEAGSDASGIAGKPVVESDKGESDGAESSAETEVSGAGCGLGCIAADVELVSSIGSASDASGIAGAKVRSAVGDTLVRAAGNGMSGAGSGVVAASARLEKVASTATGPNGPSVAGEFANSCGNGAPLVPGILA